MNAISVTHPIRKELDEQGFSFVLGDSFTFSHEVNEFRVSWNNLPKDQYLESCDRERRFSRLTFVPKTGAIELLPHMPFVQSGGVNELFDNVSREFEPMEDDVIQSDFLHDLLRADFAQLPIDTPAEAYEILVHQFRIVVYKSLTGNPVPEGKHHDGFQYVILHLMNRENVKGGENTIYSTEGETVLQKATMTSFMDSVYLDDERVMHDASPIKRLDPQKSGFRDILIFDIV